MPECVVKQVCRLLLLKCSVVRRYVQGAAVSATSTSTPSVEFVKTVVDEVVQPPGVFLSLSQGSHAAWKVLESPGFFS